MRFTTVTGILLASIPFICAEPTSVKLFHRLYHPAVEEAQFSERASLLISENNVSFQASSSYTQDLKTFAKTLRTIHDDADLALYQIAIGEASVTGQQWDISSVRVVSLINDCGQHYILSTVLLATSHLRIYSFAYAGSPYYKALRH